MLISLQGFGAVFVSPWRFIGPIWWDIRRSLHCPGTRNSSLGAGATQFKSKKVDQRFFFLRYQTVPNWIFRPNSGSFFFSRFPCVFASWTFRSCPFRAPPVEVGKQLPKAPATKRVGTSRSGLRFWWPNFFSWWGWFSSGTVFSKFHKLGYIQRNQKTLHLWLVKRMPMRQGLGSGKRCKGRNHFGLSSYALQLWMPLKKPAFLIQTACKRFQNS